MKIKDGIIYLANPLFGKTVLTGPVTVLTTCLDYTFPEGFAVEGEAEISDPASRIRVIIPLSNVLAVVAEKNEPSGD
jgi:hypothetical protein